VDDAALLTLAATQHGVVSDGQAYELGYSARMIRGRVRAGEWSRPLPRVLQCVGAPHSGRQAAMTACLWAGPDAVISHATAGVLWALDGMATTRVELTVPYGRGLRSPLVTVHRTLGSSAVERHQLHGIPITSVTRTLIDLAGSIPSASLELAMEDAFRRRLTTPARLASCLSALEPGRRSGIAQLRALLESRSAATTGSAAEVRLERLLVRGGLPRPARQHAVTNNGRTIYVDLAYPDCRLAIEFDSLRWHTGRAKLDNDAERRNQLRAARWDLVTVTYTMLHSRPADVLATITTAYTDCCAKATRMRPESFNGWREGG
jgi:very-short-patch-repair endonuclease